MKFHCKKCGQKLSAEENQRGRIVYCPTCNSMLTVPVEGDEPESNPVTLNCDLSKSFDRQHEDMVWGTGDARKPKETDKTDDEIERSATGFTKAMAFLTWATMVVWLLLSVLNLIAGVEGGKVMVMLLGAPIVAVIAILCNFLKTMVRLQAGIYKNTKS